MVDKGTSALNVLKHEMELELFKLTKNQAISMSICISCKRPAESHVFTNLGWKEYFISGFCEDCFDDITGPL